MFIRVDDRLIHGQVVTAWVKQLKNKYLLLLDDKAAANPILKKGMQMATPAGVKLFVGTIEKGKHSIGKFPEKELLIIVGTAVSALEVIRENTDYQWEVNIGNSGMADGREKLVGAVYMDSVNKHAVTEMDAMENVQVYFQTIPGQTRYLFSNM